MQDTCCAHYAAYNAQCAPELPAAGHIVEHSHMLYTLIMSMYYSCKVATHCYCHCHCHCRCLAVQCTVTGDVRGASKGNESLFIACQAAVAALVQRCWCLMQFAVAASLRLTNDTHAIMLIHSATCVLVCVRFRERALQYKFRTKASPLLTHR